MYIYFVGANQYQFSGIKCYMYMHVRETDCMRIILAHLLKCVHMYICVCVYMHMCNECKTSTIWKLL